MTLGIGFYALNRVLCKWNGKKNHRIQYPPVNVLKQCGFICLIEWIKKSVSCGSNEGNWWFFKKLLSSIKQQKNPFRSKMILFYIYLRTPQPCNMKYYRDLENYHKSSAINYFLIAQFTLMLHKTQKAMSIKVPRIITKIN